jgi:hypothetical protein
VLAWAEGADPRETHHLPINPWNRERRRSQKMVMPRKKNPKRPSMTEELHELLIDQSPNWRFDGVMELCRETVHRRNSVRLLRWEDVDLQRQTIRWRRSSTRTASKSLLHSRGKLWTCFVSSHGSGNGLGFPRRAGRGAAGVATHAGHLVEASTG